MGGYTKESLNHRTEKIGGGVLAWDNMVGGTMWNLHTWRINETNLPKKAGLDFVQTMSPTVLAWYTLMCFRLIGASLSEPHTSVTALSTCVCIYVCLDRPLTVNFKWAHSKFAKPWEWAWSATARLQGWCERERGWNDSNSIRWQHAQQITFCESDDRVTRQAMSDRQQDVRWLQVRAWHESSYIAGIPLLDYGLTVKLSPCQYSHRLWHGLSFT